MKDTIVTTIAILLAIPAIIFVWILLIQFIKQFFKSE